MRTEFDITPEQYHAGLDKLWAALGVTGPQEQDVFTLAAQAIAEGNDYKIGARRNSDRVAEFAKIIGVPGTLWKDFGMLNVLDYAKRMKARIEMLEADLDPPICRLQFPDGSVPGNAREAAEGWKKWADEFQRRADVELDRLRNENAKLRERVLNAEHDLADFGRTPADQEFSA